MAEWKDWRKNDVIFGIIIPTVIVFLILILTTEVRSFFDANFPEDPTDPYSTSVLTAILVDGLGEAILTVGIPLFAGLIWNQWAGGAAGFLTGSIYMLYVNDTWAAAGYVGSNMMSGEISALGYMVSAMLIGYMAGALNRGSFSFKRMVIASLIAGIIGGLIELWTQVPQSLHGLSTVEWMITDPLWTMFVILAVRVVYAILVPIFATVFGWYGFSPRHMS